VGWPVKQLEQYAEQARDCRAAAANARGAEEREHLLQMAERWEELARQRAAHLNLEDILADLLKGERNGGHNGGSAAAA
jgi:phytoene/squalene synthetase